MTLERLTISERAVLRAVDAGASTVQAVLRATGAAGWWIVLCVDGLVAEGRLRRLRDGSLRVPR